VATRVPLLALILKNGAVLLVERSALETVWVEELAIAVSAHANLASRVLIALSPHN
jgi:hypothetical protein